MEKKRRKRNGQREIRAKGRVLIGFSHSSPLDLVHLGTSSERAHSPDLSSWPRWTCVMKSSPAHVESFYTPYPAWPCPSQHAGYLGLILDFCFTHTHTRANARAHMILSGSIVSKLQRLHVWSHNKNHIQYTIYHKNCTSPLDIM